MLNTGLLEKVKKEHPTKQYRVQYNQVYINCDVFEVCLCVSGEVGVRPILFQSLSLLQASSQTIALLMLIVLITVSILQ